MMQSYQIFLNLKSVLFVKYWDSCGKNSLKNTKILETNKLSDVFFSSFLDEKDTFDWILVCEEQINDLFSEFKKKFGLISAAGGLVESTNGDILFIFRNGVWDLPKGKVETGEDLVDAAVREVEEECGIKALVVEKKLTETYHIYSLNNKYILKETHWYKMKTEKEQELIPQLEEGITKVEWVKKKDIPKVLKNTYPNIQLLITKYQ